MERQDSTPQDVPSVTPVKVDGPRPDTPLSAQLPACLKTAQRYAPALGRNAEAGGSA